MSEKEIDEEVNARVKKVIDGMFETLQNIVKSNHSNAFGQALSGDFKGSNESMLYYENFKALRTQTNKLIAQNIIDNNQEGFNNERDKSLRKSIDFAQETVERQFRGSRIFTDNQRFFYETFNKAAEIAQEFDGFKIFKPNFDALNENELKSKPNIKLF